MIQKPTVICALMSIYIALGVIDVVNAAPVHDQDREQLIAERLSARIERGQALELGSEKKPLFAIYTPTTEPEVKGAVVLLHGMAAHPDWPGLIHFLRTTLPDHGWDTLAVQMPVLAPETPIERYGRTTELAGQRIKKAVEYLRNQGQEHVFVVGYGFGAASALKYLTTDNPGALGLVGISFLAQKYLSPKLKVLDEISKLQLPLLDIYGSDDREVIVEAAADRRLSARKAENPYYKQIMIGGADHDYTDQEAILMKRMRVWMEEMIAQLTLSQDNADDRG